MSVSIMCHLEDEVKIKVEPSTHTNGWLVRLSRQGEDVCVWFTDAQLAELQAAIVEAVVPFEGGTHPAQGF